MSGAASRPGGRQAWWVWTLAAAFVAYLFSCQAAYAIVNPGVESDLGVSVAQAGMTAAVYTWAIAIFQLFGGALLDRFGAQRVLPASIGLVTAGVFLFANAGTYEALVLSHLILALGAGTGLVGACYIGGHWFGKARFGVMFGLTLFVAALASAVARNVLPAVVQQVGWRILFLGMGALGLALLALARRGIRDPTPIDDLTEEGIVDFFGSVVRGIFKVAMVPHVWIASLQAAALFGTLLSLGAVNGSSRLPWIGLAVGSLVVVRWSDAIRSRKVPILAGIAIQLGCLMSLLYLPSGGAPGMVLGALLGFSGAVCVLSFSTVDDVVSSDHMGTSAATVNGVMFVVSGIVIAHPGLSTGAPLLIALGIAMVLALVMKETYPPSPHNSGR